MVDRHGGEVPRDHEELLALPGVGAYTAAAVSCFAFGLPEVVVDTNVRRVLARTLEGKALPHLTLNRAETDLARASMPTTTAAANTWNVAVMELGALVCVARGPRCEVAPSLTSARGTSRVDRPTTGPPDEDRPGTAPTVRCVARSFGGCGRRPGHCRARSSCRAGRTRRRCCGASTRWLPTGCWSPSRAAVSASPPDPSGSEHSTESVGRVPISRQAGAVGK